MKLQSPESKYKYQSQILPSSKERKVSDVIQQVKNEPLQLNSDSPDLEQAEVV